MRRVRQLVIVVIVAGGLVAGAAVFADATGRWPFVNEVAIGSPEAAPGLNADERAYYDYVSPRLRALSGEAATLATMGAAKSRNLIALQQHGDHVTTLIGQIDAFTTRYGTPPRFATAAATYRQGAAAVRGGMDEARQGFLRFDWNRVKGAVTLFDRGAAGLDHAAQTMDASAGVTPVASPAIRLGASPAARR